MTATMVSDGRVAAAGRGVGTAAVTAGVLVGAPWLLWAFVGRPFPSDLPTLDDASRAVTSSALDESAVVQLLALVGWVLWVAFAVSLAVEVTAWARGRPAVHIPGLGPLQGVARHLIASATIVVAAPVAAGASSLRVAAPVVVAHVHHDKPLSSSVGGSSTLAPTKPAPEQGGYVVQRRDSLWAIAECQLGDPLRWPEIWELNRDRVFDGVRFTDANLIFPGWELTLPGAAPVIGAIDPTPPAELPQPSPPSDAGSAPTSSTAPMDDSVDEATDGSGSPERGGSDVETPGGDAGGGSRPSGDWTESGSPSSSVERWGPFAVGTLLAASVVLALTRLRRSQSRRRPPGRTPHQPNPATAPVEAALRRTAEPDRLSRLVATLRAFAAGASEGTTLPALSAVRVGGDEIELLFDGPLTDTPPGFVDRGGLRCFATEAGLSDSSLAGLGRDSTNPWPALIEIGALGDDVVLLDLERAASLALSGDGAAGCARHIATELALSPVSDLVELIVVGEELDLSASPRIHRVSTVIEGIEHLESQVRSTRVALGAARTADCPTARQLAADSPWGTVVLVVTHELDEPQRCRLADVLEPGLGAAVVFVGDPLDGGWSATVGDSLRLDPHGFDLTPLPLDVEMLESIDDLLCDASVGDADEGARIEVAASEEAGPEIGADEAETLPPVHLTDVGVESLSSAGEEEPEVEIRIIGPVEIDGGNRIDRRRTVELITYLALHPEGVTNGQLRTAIWPDADPSQDTFNVTVYRARSGLGLDSAGNHHLPHSVNSDGRYRLGPHTATDLSRFVHLVRRAVGTTDADEARTLLVDAMGMIRGQLLEGANGFEWAFTSGVVTEAEATIADAAHRLAQLALADNDGKLAAWAAMQGLRAVPGSEPLYRDRMEAAHLAGDPAAVDRIVEELCRYLETLDPFEDLHPETLKLWRRLGRPPRVA